METTENLYHLATLSHTHNFIHLLKGSTIIRKNESENVHNQHHKTLFSAISAMTIMFSEADGNGQLNIMQQLATSFDLVLKIFINAPTTV